MGKLVPMIGDGNLQQRLKGLLNSEQPFKSSLQGTLIVTANNSQTRLTSHCRSVETILRR
jgi:hypothetical protein